MKAVLGTIFIWLGILSLGLVFYAIFTQLGLTKGTITPVGMFAIVMIAFGSMLLAFITMDKLDGGNKS
jgi:hypothetical protein